MNTLDQEIAELKDVIKRFQVKFFAATTEKEMEILADLIKVKSDHLSRLLDQYNSSVITG